MKNFFPALAVVCLGLAGCATDAREPRNLDLPKAELRDYVSSGRYPREIAAVAAQMDAWLVERAAHRAGGERLAVVLDLDETLLSNWRFIDDEDFGGTDAEWDAWMGAAKDPAIEPVREVYRTARKLGMEVFFLTSRREHLRRGTEENLRAIGCADYAALILEPEAWKGPVAVFKAAERKRLTAEGHVIIANIGDQDSDLAGGDAERVFKLPDPFYFTP